MKTWRKIIGEPCPCGGYSMECLECDDGLILPLWVNSWEHCTSLAAEEELEPFAKDMERLEKQAKRLLELMPHRKAQIEEDFQRAVLEVDKEADRVMDGIERESYKRRRGRK
jgi:hypothetical protein